MALSFQAGMDRLVQWFARLETGVVIVLLAFVTAFGLIQILLRNVFATGLLWGDTFLRHAVLWICMLGAARAVAEDKHIHIDLLLKVVPAKLGLVLRFIASLLPVLISVVLVYASWEFVQNERSGENMAFGFLPGWWLQLVFPFSFLVMTLRFAARLVAPSAHRAEGPEA
jgi:TRAP-type C4-dicarboxylate transport system permease small subunit